MSAHDHYQPHVYLDGRKLNERAKLVGLTPVADIRIVWGGRDWWQNLDPSRLTMLLLDPFGELLSLKRGIEVKVTCDPDERVLFRGTLDASQATWTHRTNENGRRVSVWEVEVEAYDPLAALAGDRAHGPAYTARNGQVNRLHWGRSLIRERYADLAARSPAPIAFEYLHWHAQMDETAKDSNMSNTPYPCAPYTTQQNVSVLTVLRNTARLASPLARPYYDHSAGIIRLLKPPAPEATPARNAQLASGFEISMNRSVSTVPVTELNGARFYPEGGDLRLDLQPQDNLTYARLLRRSETLRPADSAAGIPGTHYEVDEDYPTTIQIGGSPESTVELDTDLPGRWEGIGAGWYGGVSELMRATHEFRALPSFSYELRVDDLESYEDWQLFDQTLFRAHPTHDTAGVLGGFILVNTPLQWGGTLPSFSIVGGELRYTSKRGWTITCNPAAIPTQPDTGTTLGDITLNAPISSFADRYTVGDLQLL